MSDRFEYDYYAPTAAERREIEDIRGAYLPAKENDLVRLRKLDRKVKLPAKIFAIIVGVAGLLVFGLGLALAVQWGFIYWGIAVGAVGVAAMASAYFLHGAVFKRRAERYGAEIVRLSDSLLNGEKEDG